MNIEDLQIHIEEGLVKTIYEELDYYSNDDYKFTISKNEDSNYEIFLSFVPDFELEFNKIFNIKKHGSYIYVIESDFNLDLILDDDELFIHKYKNSLQINKILLLYFCIDNENKLLYTNYKDTLTSILKNIIIK